MTDEELEKELRRMKGKRTCKKRLLAFMLIFAMLAGMVMNPIHLQAVEGGAGEGRDLYYFRKSYSE